MALPRTAPGRLGEIRFFAEATPGATITTPSTYWAGSYKKVRAWDFAAQLKKLSETDPAMQTSPFIDPAPIMLGKGGSASFKCHLTGLSPSYASGTATLIDDLGLILVNAMGGEDLNTSGSVGVASGVGATAAMITTAGTAAGLTAGSAVRVGTEMRRIVSISSENVTLDMDLTSAPASTTAVAASASYYLDESALVDLSDSGHDTLAVLFRGYDSEDQWQMRGVFPTIELSDLGASKPPKLEVTCNILDWELVSSVAVGAAFTEQNPTAQVNSGLYLNVQSTTESSRTKTINAIHTKNLSIKLGLKATPLESPTGQQGVVGHMVLGDSSTELEFETTYDSQWNVWYEAGTPLYAGYQLGTSVLITFPMLYISETPERAGAGMTSIKVKLKATNGPTTTTELTRSRVAIHRFPVA